MIVVMCPGCSKKISSKTDESLQITEDPYKPYIEEKLGIQVDNDTPLKQLLTKEYELSELQDFFGKDASRLRDKKLYLFDMDGTIADSMGHWKNIEREFLIKKGEV